MESAGWGRIVNVAARSGLVGIARATHYAAAKAAIVGLTASLAKELGPAGILVNAVAPTQILTVKDGVPSIPDDRAAEMAKTIPLRRLATPDDLARLGGLARLGCQPLRHRRDGLADRRRAALRRILSIRPARRHVATLPASGGPLEGEDAHG